MSYLTMLNEVCTFSAIKATTALSKFLDMPLGLEMKVVEIQSIDELKFFNDCDNKTVSVFLPISGTVPGACFFIYSEQAALSLCDVLFHKESGATNVMSDSEISALTEVANIMIGNFLTVFAQSLHIDLMMHKSPIFDFAPFKDTINLRFPMVEESMKKAVLSISFGFKHVNIIRLRFSYTYIQYNMTMLSKFDSITQKNY